MIARWAVAALFFACLIGLWQLAVNAQIWSPLLLPSPTSVFVYVWSAVEDGTMWEATLVTVRRLLI